MPSVEERAPPATAWLESVPIPEGQPYSVADLTVLRQTLRLEAGWQGQPWMRNNHAFKFLQDESESEPGRPSKSYVDLMPHDPFLIRHFDWLTGTGERAYCFTGKAEVQWSWRHMLATLADDDWDLHFGPNNQSSILQIGLVPVPGSTDLDREKAVRVTGKELPLNAPAWNFSFGVPVARTCCFASMTRTGVSRCS